MPNQVLDGRNLIQVSVGVPTVGLNRAASWGGNSMAPYAVTPLLPGLVFNGRGHGVYHITQMPGVRGAIEALFLTPSITLGVAATGSITTVGGADLIDEETFVLDDGVHTPTTFEFDDDMMATGEPVAFTGADAVATVKTAIIAAINGASDLDIVASPGGPGIILLENEALSEDGNATIISTVVDTDFDVTGMSGGVTAGPLRDVLYLVDDLDSPTGYILLSLDEFNRPQITIKDATGSDQAVTASVADTVVEGTLLRVQLSWDSEEAIVGARFASLKVNGAETGDTWSTDPTSSWASFVPQYLVVGRGLDNEDFTGVVESFQLSNTP